MPEFTDARGVSIVYDIHHPDGPPRAVVQLLHGVGEHAGRYATLCEALSGAGYLVYADDHRGHGRTGMQQHGGDAGKLGRLGPGGHRAAVDALSQFTQLIRDENPDLPFVLLGHSWGSFLSQILVARHPEAYDLLVLSGSALRWPGAVNSGSLNTRWAGPDANGVEWLATDAAVHQEFLDDPLTTDVPMQKLFGLPDTVRAALGRPKKDLGRDIPTLLLVGRDDPLAGPRSVHRLADAYRNRSGFTDVTTLVYPDVRHEVFNDVTQADVRADLLTWLDRRVPARA